MPLERVKVAQFTFYHKKLQKLFNELFFGIKKIKFFIIIPF